MKRLFIFLFIIMLLTSVNVFAVTEEEEASAAKLKTLGILKGYEDGTLRLENNIIRSEVAALAVRISNIDGAVVEGEGKEFTDVSADYWAYGVISDAYKMGIIHGYPDDTFKPKNNITYAEVVAIMVNVLGKTGEITGEWPENYLNKAKELGIIPADSEVDPNKIVTRGEMSHIVWRTLIVKK